MEAPALIATRAILTSSMPCAAIRSQAASRIRSRVLCDTGTTVEAKADLPAYAAASATPTSASTAAAALRPFRAMTLPAGWVAAPHM